MWKVTKLDSVPDRKGSDGSSTPSNAPSSTVSTPRSILKSRTKKVPGRNISWGKPLYKAKRFSKKLPPNPNVTFDAPKEDTPTKPPSKKQRIQLSNQMDDWDWCEVSCPDNMVLGDDAGGFLCLEEIDGVNCVWEDNGDLGRTVRFEKVVPTGKGAVTNPPNAAKPGKANPDAPLTLKETRKFISVDDFSEGMEYVQNEDLSDQSDTEAIQEESTSSTPEHANGLEETAPTNGTSADRQPIPASEIPSPEDVELSESEHNATKAWQSLQLQPQLYRALAKLGFTNPTPIQAKTLPLALAGRDVVGAAETGSGKTLAFGIPMLNYHLRHYSKVSDKLVGLVLTPTRELAVQVRDHLQALAQYTQARVITIVGGMAIQKQRRLLKRSPNIIVATPGRLWELLSEDNSLASQIHDISFLAIDEADRMLERGHFAELTSILKSLDRRPESAEFIDYSTSEPSMSSTPASESENNTPTRQTLVFSATITTDLRFSQRRPVRSKNGESASTPKVLQDLMDRIHFKEAKPCLVDVTQDKVTAAKLREVRIDCLKTEKDLYLYYLVTRYPARTLVFVNSIDALRRLVPVFQLLQVPAYGLHSQMEQRARLKNIDRFKANKHAVLIASDVAARGLDIPLVEHVVHYQIPTAADVYVHRSGRTARAQQDGISILLYCPEETKAYQKLCTVLKKSSIPEFPVDRHILHSMKKRTQLARKINDEEHRMKKTKFESDWLRQQAQAMDIELDDGLLSGDDDDDDGRKAQQAATVKAKIRQWKQELRLLLEQPIVTRAEARGGKLVTTDTIQELLASQVKPTEYNPHISMLKLSKAVTDFEQK